MPFHCFINLTFFFCTAAFDCFWKVLEASGACGVCVTGDWLLADFWLGEMSSGWSLAAGCLLDLVATCGLISSSEQQPALQAHDRGLDSALQRGCWSAGAHWWAQLPVCLRSRCLAGQRGLKAFSQATWTVLSRVACSGQVCGDENASFRLEVYYRKLWRNKTTSVLVIFMIWTSSLFLTISAVLCYCYRTLLRIQVYVKRKITLKGWYLILAMGWSLAVVASFLVFRRVREIDFFSIRKWRLKDDLVAVYSYPLWRCRKGRGRLFLEIHREDRLRKKKWKKLKHRMFQVGMRIYLSPYDNHMHQYSEDITCWRGTLQRRI